AVPALPAPPAPPRADRRERQPGERGDHERAGVDCGARMPPHLLAHVGEIAVHEAPAPDPRLVDMPGQHDGEDGEPGDHQGAERRPAVAGRRQPVRGEHRGRPERERALAEEGDAEPDPRPPEAISSAREGTRRGEEPRERAQRERRVEQERAPEADEAGREREDRAAREPDALVEQEGAEPPEDETGGDAERHAREPRAPGGDAEELEGRRREPDDEGRLVEEGLPGEVLRPPLAAHQHGLRDGRVDDRVADQVAFGEPAREERGGEEGERNARPETGRVAVHAAHAPRPLLRAGADYNRVVLAPASQWCEPHRTTRTEQGACSATSRAWREPCEPSNPTAMRRYMLYLPCPADTATAPASSTAGDCSFTSGWKNACAISVGTTALPMTTVTRTVYCARSIRSCSRPKRAEMVPKVSPVAIMSVV